MRTARKIAKNTLALLFSSVTGQGLFFVVSVYLARILSKSDFGIINWALAFVSYFAFINNFGIPLFGSREIARHPEAKENLSINVLLIRFVFGIIAALALLITVVLLPRPESTKEIILIYGVTILYSSLNLEWFFQGIEKMEYSGIGRIVNAAVYCGAIFIFVRSQANFKLVPIIYVAAGIVSTLTMILMFFPQISKFKWKFSINDCKAIFSASLPFGISILLIQIIYNIDTVMLGFMRTDAEVGIYSVAYKMASPLMILSTFFYDAMFPRLSVFFTESLYSFKYLLETAGKFIVIISLPMAVGGTFLANDILRLFFAGKYDASVPVFRILIWVVFMIYMNSLYARALWASDKQSKYLKTVAIQGVVNIVLNFMFIPRWGITGAAISTLIAEVIGFPFYYGYLNQLVKVNIGKYFFKPLLSCGAMALILFITVNCLGLNIFINLAIGIIAYFGFMFVFGGITKNDIEYIKLLKRK